MDPVGQSLASKLKCENEETKGKNGVGVHLCGNIRIDLDEGRMR